ncbi:hypothetical protein PLICRDRAFT_150569 [Plicaturopsis crispa FD-325 SS-3]|nr:hypothetical protein PLICRDRAFT_150569 [Plicaturopsis crispa FD-325 SS-3]
MPTRKKMSGRKATWIAFGLIALAAVSSTAQKSSLDDPATETSIVDVTPTLNAGVPARDGVLGSTTKTPEDSEVDEASEAARAYKHAMATLTTLTAAPPVYTNDPSYNYGNTHSNSLLSSLIPNAQGQGPLGSAIRIAIKLHQQSWVRRIASGLRLEGMGSSSKKRDEELRGKAIKVIDLLQHSAELGHSDALYTLGRVSLFPPTTHFVSDPMRAFDSFSRHAALTGNASSQSTIAFFYSTGYHDVVPVDQAKAQLYYTFAAQGGDRGAQMALAYRYWTGIGTLEDCGRALEWYEHASEQAMAKFISGPPGGRTLPQTPTRLSDLAGGAYGPGASVASTGFNVQRPAIKAGFARAVGETWEDVLEYYLFNADRGETDFAYRLGKIFYQGSIYATPGGIASGSEGVGNVPRDFQLAHHYFEKIARQVWPRDPPNPLTYTSTAHKEESHGVAGFAAASAAYLGRMFLRGEGVKADPAMAKMWFERGAEYGDRESHNGLGIIWRDGLVQGRKDMKKAIAHFTAAAGQDLAEAQVNLGKYHFNRNEIKAATAHFETAIRHGSPFEAYYYLAEIHASQATNAMMTPNMASGSCAMAVSFHKIVAERGVWDEDLLREAEVAWDSGTNRGKESAMLKWWIVAERGSEIAQNNLAYVLDQDKSILRLTRFSPITPSNDTARLALTQWTRSAAQRNIDALVKVGDYFYHGLGVAAEEANTRWEKAVRYYQSAADTQLSALAMWNLGWMYENGVGVPQDFHLAKRHYDLALETNSEAYLPVMLSLVKLHARSFWHTLMGGKGGLSLWQDEDDDDSFFQTTHGGNRELDGSQDSGHGEPKADDIESTSGDGGDGDWYMGKAKDEFHRRTKGKGWRDVARDSEEDPIQWARERRHAENDRDSDFGPEDYFEGAMRGGNREEDVVEEFGETMLLVGLVLVVSGLIYLRTRVMERLRRREREQREAAGQNPPPPPPEDLGLFPPPGDPVRDDWVIQR